MMAGTSYAIGWRPWEDTRASSDATRETHNGTSDPNASFLKLTMIAQM